MVYSVDTVFINRATSTSVILMVSGVSLIVLPILAAVACDLSLGNKILHKIIMNKNIK